MCVKIKNNQQDCFNEINKQTILNYAIYLQMILVYEMELGNSLLFLISESLSELWSVLNIFCKPINGVKVIKINQKFIIYQTRCYTHGGV